MTKTNTTAATKTVTPAKAVAEKLSAKYMVALVILMKNGEISRVNGFGTMQLRTLEKRGLITAKRNVTAFAKDVWKALGRKGQKAARDEYDAHFAD